MNRIFRLESFGGLLVLAYSSEERMGWDRQCSFVTLTSEMLLLKVLVILSVLVDVYSIGAFHNRSGC